MLADVAPRQAGPSRSSGRSRGPFLDRTGATVRRTINAPTERILTREGRYCGENLCDGGAKWPRRGPRACTNTSLMGSAQAHTPD